LLALVKDRYAPPQHVGVPRSFCSALAAKEWMPKNFDPAIVNVYWLANELIILAKRWSRKPKCPKSI
jgi:hypothetical protein